jgi:negative regulator of sigma E activity
VSLYHKVLDKYLVTVVGEVPPRTVIQVLDSVRYNGKWKRAP